MKGESDGAMHQVLHDDVPLQSYHKLLQTSTDQKSITSNRVKLGGACICTGTTLVTGCRNSHCQLWQLGK